MLDVPELKYKECPECLEAFAPVNTNHKYCGSIKDKVGCSYLIYKKNQRQLDQSENKKDYLRRYASERRLKLRFRILEAGGFVCCYCGRKPPEATLQIDHKFPKSKGGKNDISNYVVACMECNNGKGDYILNEFNN